MTTSCKGAVLLPLATFIGLGVSYGEPVLTGKASAALPSSVGRSPTDIVYGIDYAPDPVQLARLRINRPELIQYLGDAEPPGETNRVLDACDFRGNDFSTLYCLDTENFGPDDTTRLITVDAQTAKLTFRAEFTLPGEETNEGVNGLTYDPTTGRMYAVSCAPFFGSQSALYELDLDALTLTQIGQSTEEDVCMKSLGADNQGRLWGTDDVFDGLEAVDKESGTMTFVGPFGFDAGFGGGMDFDASDNTCYVFVFNVDTFRGELHRCDTGTGQTQFVGALGEQNHGEGHWGTGAIAAPADCHVTLDLGAEEVQAGDPLSIRVGVVHNRAETVTVPLALAMEDAAGNVVARRTATRKMKVGDHLDRTLLLRVPKSLPPGPYRVTLAVGEMEQGNVRRSKMLTVVEPASDSVDNVPSLARPCPLANRYRGPAPAAIRSCGGSRPRG